MMKISAFSLLVGPSWHLNLELASLKGHPPLRHLAWQMAAAITAALFAIVAPSYAGTWDHPRGNAANTGFANVATATATMAAQRVSGLGRFAPGAGPVIGPDGMVYVGNFDGQLWAIRPDGSHAWMRALLRGQHIMASPVIGADGDVYVIGTKSERRRDHRAGSAGEPYTRYETTLYRFSGIGGGMRWSSDFPATNPAAWGTGAAPAAPNIWRSGETEVIIVPAEYHTYGGRDVRLAAFSTNGALLSTQTVTSVRYELTGGTDFSCFFPGSCFDGRVPPPDPFDVAVSQLGPLRPAVAIFARGGEPVVVVADRHQNIVGYIFAPATGFQETFRKHLTNDARGIGMSSPVALPDGHSVLRGWTSDPDQRWLLFGGPHPINWSEVVLPAAFEGSAVPTLTADGRIVTVSPAGVIVVRAIYPKPEIALIVPVALRGRLAPASASRNQIFVSTGDALLTFDANTLQVAARFDWQGGGVSSPAIGADGRVYALAGDTLIMFPPPPRSCPRRVCPDDLDPIGGQPATQGAAQAGAR